MHDAHMETMKQKFEDAKKRMNLMQQRVRQGSPVIDGLRSDADAGGGSGLFPDVPDSAGGGGGDKSSFLFDQFRRRTVARTKPPDAPPHPELTPAQRQHIQDKRTIPNQEIQASPVPRRFNTGGSVAERVMIFERAPSLFSSDGIKASAAASSLSSPGEIEKKKEPNWRANLPDTSTSNRVRLLYTLIRNRNM